MQKNNSKKILHVCSLDKFIPPFIDLIENYFPDFEERHVFWVDGDRAAYPYRARKNIVSAPKSKIKSILSLMITTNSAEKIILHGLFSFKILLLLTLMPWLHRKCYWVIWGGDLYCRQQEKKDMKWSLNELLRKSLIPRLAHLVTHIKGDVELAKIWYGATGSWFECFMYPSNLFQYPVLNSKVDETINILIGNSADPSNNHIEILDKLAGYKEKKIKIFIPLSYGDDAYADVVIKHGLSLFGEKLMPIKDFMEFKEYLQFLASIDIAIFNHRRQQGMGNAVSLLGFGKTVFMRSDVSQWDFFCNLGIVLNDASGFSLNKIKSAESENNTRLIANYFSKEKLIEQLKRIFGE